MPRLTTQRADIHQQVTDRIIAELAAGVPPWVQPWSDAAGLVGMPHNAITCRAYSGINVLLLWLARRAGNFRDQAWLTFKQAQDAGGCVRRGSRGVTIVYAHHAGQRADGAGDEDRRGGAMFLRYFTVFNVAQCDGLPARFTPNAGPEPLLDVGLSEAIAELSAGSSVDIVGGAAEAFYTAYDDTIHMPSRNWFDEPLDHERIFLHELIHATGHEGRIGRDLTSPFGTRGYAREELIAELGAAFLCAEFGIPPTVRHASYIDSWIDVLRDDKRAIFKAASAASRAVTWLRERRTMMVEQLMADYERDQLEAA